MTEMRAAYRLDLVGNLFRNARRVSAEMERMSGRSEDALARMQRRTAAVENGIGALTRRATGLAAGFVGVGEVRRLIRAEEVIRQIGVNAGWSDERIDALARRNGALAAEWSVLASDIVEGQDRIQAMTGNLDFGEAVAEQIAIARRATGAGGSDVGGMIGMLHNIAGVRDVSGIGQALDIWAAQGNVGQFELASFAAVGSEAGTAYQPLHRQGEDFARELGAIMNMLAGATGGNAPKAVTLLENLIPKLLSADIESRLQGAGVRFRDAAGEYRAGTDILMDTTKALYAKAGQAGMTPQQALEKLFGKDLEIGKAFAPFIEDFRDGAFDQLETYLAVETGGILDRNALRMKETAAAALTGALGDIRQVTGEMLSGPIREMAAALNALDAGTVARWGEIAKHLGIAFAAWKGVQIGAGVVGAISDLRNLRRGRVGGAISGGLTAASGVAGALGDLKPQPVIVTNWPAGFGMGTGSGHARSGQARPGRTATTAGGLLARVAPPLAVAAGALALGDEMLDTSREAEEREETFTAARERRLGIPEGLETPLGRLPNLPDPVSLLGEALTPLLGRLRTAGTGKTPAPEKAAPVIRSRLAEFGAGASAFRPALPSPGTVAAPTASAAGAGLVERPPSLADISAGLTAFFPARPEAQDTAPSDPALLDAVRDVTDEVRSVGERIGDVERALKTRPLQHATPGSTGRLSVHP